MDLFTNLALGLATAVEPINLLYCLIGVVIGTAIGVLPGIGPIPTVALLLPFTFGLEATSAFIMLAGIFYGAQYGGSTTAILVNVPGETSAVITCLDGHKMAQNGRAGPALAIAAISSFYAGTIATVVICLLSVPLSVLALKFTAVEYFSLLVLGLLAAVILAHGSVMKALAMVLLGLLLGLIGIDVSSGAARMTFGVAELGDGIDFVPVAMGMFGLGEIMANLERPPVRQVVSQKVRDLIPSLADLRAAFPAMTRGTLIGSILGVLPGGGAALPPFTAYAVEKKVSKNKAMFGHGAIEGVAAPEAANNAGAQTSFIPLLTLGIPANALMALMIGALMMHGIQPGPQIMTEQPQLVWGVIASMWVGNLMLLVINLPLVGIWVSMLKIPYRLLFPAIALLCCIGTYGIANSVFNIWLMLGCAVIGYFFIKVGAEPAPLLLGLVLGPQLEENFRRAMMLSDGDFTVFVQRPISATLLGVAALLILVLLSPTVFRKRKEALAE
ncbi:tripartite tricarboxylate transporter permease [Rhodoplanes sp. TEM]|uniref:Tripartite tricarboxylate transporter permease n=1 Tax=Rhodoplanes tepidamans TaxID=200616 RepID=A0ABT5J3F8_RHOTP|nr:MULTISPECIES: tripartite tricarboxylate transporter permease [Rhodoplanes]MDC7784113.1 tripartite tricarboxylate transporter permease [Rhodoplanes tepidamans]MDC7983208.1 tripartite tricarboxylate transporter permease [Rhodoplanes sp. TEM]MDQ0356790.1 TctA family transporter [Rhodoplanes tepidamans]